MILFDFKLIKDDNVTLCKAFQRLAVNTWRIIELSRRVDFQLKEETFIDINMLCLKTFPGGEIKIKVFTKPEEGKHGADWEWWFKSKANRWIGFRIQSKILNIRTNKFEHLHYKTKKGLFQSDILIQKSLRAHMPMIPLYCLFLQEANSISSQFLLSYLWGCSLVSAFSICDLRYKGNCCSLSDLKNLLEPWHYLVCHAECNGGGDMVYNIQKYVFSSFYLPPSNKRLGHSIDAVMPENFVLESPPDYVRKIVKNSDSDDVRIPDRNLRGVIVFDEVQD